MRRGLLHIVIALCCVVYPGIATAHQPVYVGTQTTIQIPDPVVSRAYYGALSGSPAVYSVTLPTDTEFYVNILSPDIPGAQKNFVVRMAHSTGNEVLVLSAPENEWVVWHEEFAGDSYWKGPEFKDRLPAGTYTLTVTNDGNVGAYVLAPGEAEVFTFGGTPNTVAQIYLVKTEFFGKSWVSIFEGIIGTALLSVLVVVLVLCGILAYLLNRTLKKKTLV